MTATQHDGHVYSGIQHPLCLLEKHTKGGTKWRTSCRFCLALPHVSLVSLDVSCVVQCGVEIAFNCIQENWKKKEGITSLVVILITFFNTPWLTWNHSLWRTSSSKPCICALWGEQMDKDEEQGRFSGTNTNCEDTVWVLLVFPLPSMKVCLRTYYCG